MKYLVYILTFIIWIGSLILSFFAGLITMEVINYRDARNRRPYNTSKKAEPKKAEDSKHLVRPFNENTTKHWSTDPEVNLLHLHTTEDHINNVLRNRGHVFLNDVYDLLGMKRTSHGAIAGWLFTDNKLIAFTPRDLKPGDAIELEFDYDGIIYDRLVVLD